MPANVEHMQHPASPPAGVSSHIRSRVLLACMQVVSTEYSEVYSLARQDLSGVVAQWPDLKEELDDLCRRYLEQVRDGFFSARMEVQQNIL